jgi:putative FmdB family regulatory protein
MPIYEYRCPSCGLFSELVKMSEASAPAACPACQEMAPRVLSVPRLTTLSRAQRSAWERNEKSAHEPQRASRHTCSAGAGGCGHNKPRRTQPKRPWMLGH